MADFGDPSTWEMNVDQFIDSGLPKEKPQELLDLQEQNRKQRLLQSLQRIGGGLEDSSIDFINRENFDKGTRAKPTEEQMKKKNLRSKERYYKNLTSESRRKKTLQDQINLIKNWEKTVAENPGLKEAHINNLYRKENGKFFVRRLPLRPFKEVFADFGIKPGIAKEFSSLFRKELKADGLLGMAKRSDIKDRRNKNIKKAKADAGPTVRPVQKKTRNTNFKL